ncbi:hypothetical protein CPC08DRAFT_755724 [Agrocybe pediades]|nr:hypothetical protein CPC08DRAFT_755724 [Agrocybe pediades]
MSKMVTLVFMAYRKPSQAAVSTLDKKAARDETSERPVKEEDREFARCLLFKLQNYTIWSNLLAFEAATYVMETTTLSQHESPARTRKNVKSTTTRVTPNLPVELHKLIVDELEGDKKALEQCALTCRLYRNLAQKLLFKSVAVEFPTLSFRKSQPVTYKFIDIMRASPHIADYVQRLHIHRYRPMLDTVQSDESLSMVLRALPNVVDLVLGKGEMIYDLSQMPPAVHSAIMDKCQILLSLTLRSISDVPLKIFDHLQRVETLTLKNTTFTNDPGMQTLQTAPSRIKHMTLVEVTIQDVASPFPFLVKHKIGMGELESLTIDITGPESLSQVLLSPTDLVAVRCLIRGSAEYLKVLRVKASWYAPVILPDNEPVFDLSELPLLEELSLYGAAYNRNRVSLGWISTHLQTIPANPRRFKCVTLYLSITDHVNFVAGDQMDPEGFKYFEKVIVDKILPHTESFSVDFSIWDGEDDESPIPEQIQKYLPTLHVLHLVHFS